MITVEEKEVLSDLKEKLLSLTDLLEFRLFGSRARDEHTSDADYDVLIVVPMLTSALKRKIREVIWEVGYQHDMFISALIVSKQEWYESPLRVSPIKRMIEKEGVFV